MGHEICTISSLVTRHASLVIDGLPPPSFFIAAFGGSASCVSRLCLLCHHAGANHAFRTTEMVDEWTFGGTDKGAGTAFDTVHEAGVFRTVDIVRFDELADFRRFESHRTRLHTTSAGNAGV